MPKDLVPINTSSEAYQALIEELKATVTERVFSFNWTRIEMFHDLGKILREYEGEKNITSLVETVAKDVKMTTRTLWTAVSIYDSFPDLSALPGGKNLTLQKVKRLAAGKPAEEPEREYDYNEMAERFFKKHGDDGSRKFIQALKELTS